ncbi:uncharacterized protein LOC110109722 [Dendrobium catenatum]|uniref:uncharacterized protein LOC110109722 n=1 Tax=Dendrobium catenatum TaxID=906689 RepID=UPI00109F210F|nr:uncharacterized protein LOC110109722 [Dendrobium catenatum]
MGQVAGEKDLLQKEQLDIKRLIQDVLDAKFTSLESTIETMDDFYHVIYEIVELLSEKKGAMQFKLPTKKNLKKEVDVSDFFYTNTTQASHFSNIYHSLYRIIRTYNSTSSSLQAVLDKRGAFANKSFPLNNQELKQVIQNVIKIEYFQIGKGAKDIFLYIFGVPVVGLLAKRIIPGPTASIPDEIFIPAVTSGTIILLAKTNRI